jgi:stearoyl-CoA desaturase (delta-9 desaturase)
MLKNIDLPAVFALVFLPLILISLVVFYAISYSIGWLEVILFLTGYYISMITVCVGLHRLWSHDAFKTNKVVEFILAMLAAGTLQGPILSWASNHFKHHSFTDTDQDPHSPLKYKNKVKGFLWSHMGWMISDGGSYKSITRVTMAKLGKNKILRWQLKYYWTLAIIMNTVAPALVGYILGGNLVAAYAGVLFIGLGRALQQQITFFVNSLCHFVGNKPYAKGTAGDVWWLALLLLGENWHNFHHAFPSDYRNGAKWYHLDVHKWIIYLMSKCGLAWDLKRTQDVRIEAKISQTITQVAKIRKEKLEALQVKVDELAGLYQEKKLEIEKASMAMQVRLQKSFIKSQKKLAELSAGVYKQLKDLDSASDQVIKTIERKVVKSEVAIEKLYQKIEKYKTRTA